VLGPLDPPGPDREAEAHIVEAVDAAAEQLRNTRAVCRQSYVHPALLDAYRDGTLHDHWHHSRGGRWLERPDRTLLRVLGA
jgi:DNA topoisomerase-1